MLTAVGIDWKKLPPSSSIMASSPLLLAGQPPRLTSHHSRIDLLIILEYHLSFNMRETLTFRDSFDASVRLCGVFIPIGVKSTANLRLDYSITPSSDVEQGTSTTSRGCHQII